MVDFIKIVSPVLNPSSIPSSSGPSKLPSSPLGKANSKLSPLNNLSSAVELPIGANGLLSFTSPFYIIKKRWRIIIFIRVNSLGKPSVTIT